jgi:hypothetical protein
VGTDELAHELDISAAALRAWLRREFPRAPEQRRRPWRLEAEQVRAARRHWSAEDALAEAAMRGAGGERLEAPVPLRRRGPPAVPPDLTAARLTEARRRTAEAATRVRERREAARGAREPVSRAAEALAAGLALATLGVGLLVRGAFAGGPAVALGAGAGLVVAGLGLDLYARLVGTWAARRRPRAAVACAVVGSPVVLLHALIARRGPLAPERGALAGLLVLIAAVVLLWAGANR